MNSVYILMIERHYYEEDNYKILRCYNKKDKADKEKIRLNKILKGIHSEIEKTNKCSSEYFNKLNNYFKLYPELFFEDSWDLCDYAVVKETEIV